jgi:hypothetical protein
LQNCFDLVVGKLVETKTLQRDRSAPVTSNDGFSVVRADECDGAVFDGVQECILLRLVEAMDLVDEKNGAFAVTLFSLRAVESLRADLSRREDC